MNQNHIAVMRQQFDDVLYPNLENRYHFRRASSGAGWYLTDQKTGSIYGLFYDGQPPGWRVTSITGLSSVRRELEDEVRELCTAKN